jgi:cytochrome bd-type quinol oxidase subunit 1
VLAPASTVVDLARLTLGLGPLVAIMETLSLRRRDERRLRLTHFFGTLCQINFAIGDAVGLPPSSPASRPAAD